MIITSIVNYIMESKSRLPLAPIQTFRKTYEMKTLFCIKGLFSRRILLFVQSELSHLLIFVSLPHLLKAEI